MKIKDKKITFCLTSSFYAFKDTIKEMKKVAQEGGELIPIMSINAYTTDTKYGNAKDFIFEIEKMTNKKIITKMNEAENIESDILVIAPCSRK